MRVYYFNPGYEAAVEQGNSYYTPPRMVQRLRMDLQTLPLYYADAGDGVYISFPLPRELMSERMVVDREQVCTLLPWGWSPDLSQVFPHLELPYSLEEMKRFASRSLGVELWHAVYRYAPDLFHSTPPREVSLGDTIERGNWVLKEDFSSSGRGIEFVTATQDVGAIIARRLGRQPEKRLYIEPFYPIDEERGYEFYRTGEGSIEYLGCHRAITESGRYKGSWLGKPTNDDDAYINALLLALGELPLGSYSGVIGVDTALYRDGDIERFVPCFEVNVRPTMGYVAISIEHDWLREGQVGRFMILPRKSSKLQNLAATKPLYLSERQGRLSSGLYPLTPILDETYFVACLEVL